MDIWFTSDTHFGHKQNFLFEPRGFTSADEMDEVIIERWNNIVSPNDIVYHLGDTMLNNNDHGIECFKRLNGQIFLIWGNHDTENRKNLFAQELMHKVIGGWYAFMIDYEKYHFYLSHYPTLTANYDEKHFSQHVINLHGHVHSKTPWINPRNPFMYDAGMDAHNCTPVHIDEVISDIRQRWNEIGRLPIPIQPQDTYPYGGLINDNDKYANGE